MLRIMSAGHSSRGDAASKVAEEGQRGNFLSRRLYTSLRSHDLDEVFFLSFFFFFWWGFLNQSTLCRPQSRGSQRIRHSWATQQQKSPCISQCLEDPFRKEKYLVHSLPCGTWNTNFRSKEVDTRERKANDIKANIPTEQSRACRRIVARGRPMSEMDPQDGNKNT